MRTCAFLCCSILLLLSAAEARAGTIELEFDFSGSTISLLGNLFTVPPNGSIGSGSAQISVPGGGIASPSPGLASLASFTLAATLDAPLTGANLDASAAVSQPAPAQGVLLPGLSTLVLIPPPLQASGTLDCAGIACGIVASALQVVFPFVFSGSIPIGTLMLGNLGVSGAATATALVPFSLDGLTGELQLVGTEVSRSFSAVPEPSTALLLAAGLAFTALGAGRPRLRA